MASIYTKEDTIFVQIAAYRDPELQHTLQDLFKKAKCPENIFIGLCHQYDVRDKSDADLFEIPFPRPQQIRLDELDFREARGVCYARNRVQKLWRDEKWTLMIDSHMRFEQDWDEILVTITKDLIAEGIEKPVLSTYVAPYTIENGEMKTVSSTYVGAEDMLVKMHGSAPINISKPLLAAFVSMHFCFASAKIIEEIPYDPYIYFLGEEVSMSARVWTFGWDVFVPHKYTVSHLFLGGDAKKYYRKIADHDVCDYKKLNADGRSRVRHLFGTVSCDDAEVLFELEKYGFGTVRTLRDYERFSGVNFKKILFRERAKESVFSRWDRVLAKDKIKEIFAEIDE